MQVPTLWYHPNSNTGQGTWPNLISKGAFGSGYLLYYYPPSDIINYRENSGTEVGAVAVGMNTTAWNHIVFVYDATDASNTLYVNNVKRDMGTFDWGTNDDASPIAVGTIRSPSEGSTGSVDEVAIYSYALTSVQVAAHYQAAATSP